MKIKRFEELEVWKRAIELARNIYRLTGQGSLARDWGLAGQMQRAAVSISANIVEGFEKNNNNEFIRFLKIAKGSCGELRSHLYIAREIQYLSSKEFEPTHELACRLGFRIGRFIQYLQSKRKEGEFK